jgi:hypothetical protein
VPKSDIGFPDFLFEIHFESREVPIDKLVPCLIPYKSIFFFKIFDQDKVSF